MADQVTCEVFRVSIKIDGDLASFECQTDLPPGTLVIVSADRRYTTAAGEACIWTTFNDRIEVQAGVSLNGFAGSFSISAGDRRARQLYNRIAPRPRQRMPDELTLTAVAGGRQRLREFGRNNANLMGALVTVQGELHVVQAEATVVTPMLVTLQPA